MDNTNRRGFYFAPKCQCGTSTALYEILGPGDVPARWDVWDEASKRLHVDQTDGNAWRMLILSGRVNNGVVGQRIDLDDEAATELHRRLEARDVDALASVSDDLLGLCVECREFYCHMHWGSGRCPEGHARR